MNQTRQDAYSKVVQGKLGSLAGDPSETYLCALREFLFDWIALVDARLHEVRNRPDSHPADDDSEVVQP